MFKSVLLFICTGIAVIFTTGCSKDLNVLLVTGGHPFDTVQFYKLFQSYEDISLDTVSQPQANKIFEKKGSTGYDVIVFYDMWQDITEIQKNGFLALLEKGMGMVFLHHSLVSYQNWDEYKYILGGKYWQEGYATDSSKLSGYEHDIDLHIKVLDPGHPVTKNMKDFDIMDEGYSNVEILPSIIPLLETTHPSCSQYVAWTSKYKQSGIVYIMLGHDHKAYQNESFRQLIRNAIYWTASQN
jgi:hypothetical protein